MKYKPVIVFHAAGKSPGAITSPKESGSRCAWQTCQPQTEQERPHAGKINRAPKPHAEPVQASGVSYNIHATDTTEVRHLRPGSSIVSQKAHRNTT